MTEAIIAARGLTRRFTVNKQSVEAVRGVEFDVHPGELVAFLGPNGAGKSTTLRMLTTLLAPSSGSATVAGFDVQSQASEVRRHIGYIGQGNGAGHNHRVRDELLTQGRCYGLSKAECRARADELIESLDLTGVVDRTAGTLSGGQKRRLDIALGLVHRPRLLFLDEPSTGLDPHSRANLWEHILRLRAEFGATVFLTTHYLEEADTMAERVMVIDYGQVIADDTPEALKTRHAGDLITVDLPDELAAGRAAQAADQLGGTHEVAMDRATVNMRVADGRSVLPQLLRRLDRLGMHVLAAEVKRPTLDDVFLALTGRSLRESDIRNLPAAA